MNCQFLSSKDIDAIAHAPLTILGKSSDIHCISLLLRTVDIGCKGESPTWFNLSETLIYVDVIGCAVHSLSIKTGHVATMRFAQKVLMSYSCIIGDGNVKCIKRCVV